MKLSLSQNTMAFWTKKKVLNKIIEYLNTNNSTFTLNDGVLSFEVYLSKENYSLTPYLTLSNDDKCLSIKINLRKLNNDEENNSKFVFKLNDYNNKVRFFSAKIEESSKILYLEYNTFISYDNIDELLDTVIEEIFMLQTEINEL